jgi:hypothetical protein
MAAPQYVFVPHTVYGYDMVSAGTASADTGVVAASFAGNPSCSVVVRCRSWTGHGVVFGVRSRIVADVGDGRRGSAFVGSGGGRTPSLRG